MFKSFVNLSLLKLFTTTYMLLLLICLHNNNEDDSFLVLLQTTLSIKNMPIQKNNSCRTDGPETGQWVTIILIRASTGVCEDYNP